MISVLLPVLLLVYDSLRSRVTLQAEVLALRHQILVLQRGNQKRRVKVSPAHRLLWVWLSRLWPGWRSALRIVKPETVIAWHRKGFRLYWSWKSRPRQGRPPVSAELRELIRKMSVANPGWVHHAFMESWANSASKSQRPPSPSTWCDTGGRPRRPGVPS